MRNLMACQFLFTAALVGCNTAGPAHVTEVECREHRDCGAGEYCDTFLNLCGYDCRNDLECGADQYCDAIGRCLREEELPPVPDHIGPVLEITEGSLEDLTIDAPAADVQLVSYTLANHSDRPIDISTTRIGLYTLDGSSLEGVIGIAGVRDERNRRTVAGPINLAGSMINTQAALADSYRIPPHDELMLAVRADLLGRAAEFDFVVGSDAGTLLEDARFADTGELVPADRIANDHVIVRHVRVRSMMDTMPTGTTALVVSYYPEQGILHPGTGTWLRIGTIGLESFGGDSVFRGSNVSGANIGTFSELVIADFAGTFTGVITTPTAACSCGEVRVRDPLLVRDGEALSLAVFARIATDAMPGEVTFGLNGSEVDANSAADGPFRLVSVSHGQSRLRVYPNRPIVTVLPVSSTTIVNGTDMDLFRVQVNPAVEGEPLVLGSVTLRFGGIGTFGGYIENLRVRVGSTELPREQYRIYSRVTDAETSEVRRFGEQITFVFARDLGGLGIGSGQTITVFGVPQGFLFDRDTITVGFGDQIFTHVSPYVWGWMTGDGRISSVMGDYGTIDPIVWTTRPPMGYTGAWEIEGLDAMTTLTR